MTNNDVLRSFRYALELDNTTLVDFFALADVEMPLSFLASLLKKEDEPGFEPLTDELLGLLLDGFIIKHRGKREPAPGSKGALGRASEEATPAAPDALSNNRILRSLKIALELKDTDVIAIMELASVPVSKSELSALFRREDHRNYQPCGDQFLRNFLRGLGLWHRQGRKL